MAGVEPIMIVGNIGAHGAAITGVHGCGVNTPWAAAVAEATAGFAIDEHIPNGNTFVIGTLSVMHAIGVFANTLLAGNTFNVAGAAPNEHCIDAPPDISKPILSYLLF